MSFFDWVIAYWLFGTFVAIVYRWNEPDTTDGVDLLLDFVLWPLIVYWSITE